MDAFLAAASANQDLYEITLSDAGPIVFKLLTAQAYQGLARLIQEHPRTQPEVEDVIWKLCVVLDPYGKDLPYTLAGTVTTVAQLILFLSFPKEIEDVNQGLELARAKVNSNVLLQMEAEICRIFPAFTPFELDRLKMSQIMQLMAQAEFLTKEPFKFESPKKGNQTSGPTGPAGIDFAAENLEMGQTNRITDPHELFGLRKG